VTSMEHENCGRGELVDRSSKNVNVLIVDMCIRIYLESLEAQHSIHDVRGGALMMYEEVFSACGVYLMTCLL